MKIPSVTFPDQTWHCSKTLHILHILIDLMLYIFYEVASLIVLTLQIRNQKFMIIR